MKYNETANELATKIIETNLLSKRDISTLLTDLSFVDDSDKESYLEFIRSINILRFAYNIKL